MPIRDARTPKGAELDRLADITEADVEDAARTLAQRVPDARPAIDAVEDTTPGRARGPIPDSNA